LLYADMHTARPHSIAGSLPNPLFGRTNVKFAHPQFPMYLVTRLAAYDFDGVKGMIDRALEASNRGKFVIDLRSSGDEPGDAWLRDAAILLPKDRTIFDDTRKVLYNQTDVIGYASWGSNDSNRHQRFLGFHWLPGAIMTEFVSSNARTFARPPDKWNISTWKTVDLWFAGSPQTMTADYILEGATGASGHVDEPYLSLNPRPQFLLPSYYHGRNLAESYYLSIPALSWQNVVIGDPLCSIGPPK
ncbi:MAG TPA: TIGR03790 family protein, partial [Bryobacteraceae bacterium]|nr:TIGR03790 family protein [Bryobacteraceae bacterium]